MWACAAVSARWSRNPRVTPRSSSRGTAAGTHSTARGYNADGQSTTGAGPPPSSAGPPIRVAKRGASSVADMATRVRSPRSCRTSASIPSSRSVSRPRSWTSSRMTARVLSRPGSSSRRRSRIPGVTNSTTVAGPAWRSPRTVYPTRSPIRLPSRAAKRRAAARAATRRGWVTTTRRASPAGAARLASRGGTSVVLPVPGGACTTAVPAAPPARKAAANSPSDAAKASPVPMAPRLKVPAGAAAELVFGDVTRPLSPESPADVSATCGRIGQTGGHPS